MKTPLTIALLAPLALLANRQLLPELIESGSISITATGTGQYQDESVSVRLENISSKAISSGIPIGWRFSSVRPEVQDLLVVREELFALAPGQETTVLCKAFCCESFGSAPKEGEAYSKGRLADPELVAVAKASAKRAYDDNAIQHAIWVLSDGLDIAGMGAMDSTATDSLRMAVSRLSGQAPPHYSLYYAEGGASVCSGRPEWIRRNINYVVPAGATVTIVAIGKNNQILEVLYERETLAPGVHELPVHVHVLDWPEGDYAIRAHTQSGAEVRLIPFEI